VESAFITQKLIDEYAVKNIFLVSGAAALTSGLNIGDVVIGEAYHEYDRKLGEDKHNPAITGDLETLESIRFQFSAIKQGKIISGDQLLDNQAVRDSLFDRYRALALDMDSAAVAKVAKANGCQFLSIKVILDKADDRTREDYNQNCERYGFIPARILNDYLKNHFIA